jgi:hypothetical protein
MKKKFLGVAVAIAVAAMVTFNLNINADTNELSTLTMENVAALANGEGGSSMTCEGDGSQWCPISSTYVYKVTTSTWG